MTSISIGGYCRGVTRPVAVGKNRLKNRLIGLPSSSVAMSQPSKAASPAELSLYGVPLLWSNCSNTVSL